MAKRYPHIVGEKITYFVSLTKLLRDTQTSVDSLEWGSTNEAVLSLLNPPTQPTGATSYALARGLASGKSTVYCKVNLSDNQSYIVKGKVYVGNIDD